MKKVRSQILLTPELEAEVKKLAENRGISISEAIRTLLLQSLHTSQENKKTQVRPNNPDRLYSLDEFSEQNPRIRGFKELFTVGAKITEVSMVIDASFRYYQAKNELSEKLTAELHDKSIEFTAKSVTGKLVVRRAYVVPGLENPPGPRYLGLKPDEVVGAVKQIFDYAIEHGYDKVAKSSIVAFIHPFVDPPPLKLPIHHEQKLPYGGSAVPLNQEASRVAVYAVWGNNEGVLWFDAMDSYVVDTQRMIILEKNVPQKTIMLATTLSKQSDKLEVPLFAQFQQVLSDFEIIEMARITRDATKKYGLRRIEFSFDGEASLICNESIPYQIIEATYKDISITGKIMKVGSASDVENISKNKKESPILYIAPEVIQEKAYDVLNLVAGLKKKYTVLYPGLSATAHAMRILSDFGHTALVVGNRRFADGEEVEVLVKNGEITINKLGKRDFIDYAVNLYDAKLYGVEAVGGKAMNLSILKSKGFLVPHGAALTTKCFEHEFARNAKKGELPSKLHKKEWKLDSALWQNIAKELDLKKDVLYAVRSSATMEDHEAHSFAGQFETYLKVPYSGLPEAISKVMKSAFSPSVVSYFSAMGKKFSAQMGVVVQEMVEAAKAGVVFGKDVQTHNDDLIVIDTTLGLGEGVVDGTAFTERVYFSRSKNKRVSANGGELPKLQMLLEDELQALVELSLSLERLMERTQDIEWAIDKKGRLWVIQTRAL